MGRDYYILGVGPGQFSNFSTSYYEKLGYDVTTDYFEKMVSPKVPHNTYVTYFAERGILGFSLFLAFLASCLVEARGPVSRSFLVIIMTFAFFFNIENIRILWIVFGASSLMNVQLHHSDFDEPVKKDKKVDQRKIKHSKKLFS